MDEKVPSSINSKSLFITFFFSCLLLDVVDKLMSLCLEIVGIFDKILTSSSSEKPFIIGLVVVVLKNYIKIILKRLILTND